MASRDQTYNILEAKGYSFWANLYLWINNVPCASETNAALSDKVI